MSFREVRYFAYVLWMVCDGKGREKGKRLGSEKGWKGGRRRVLNLDLDLDLDLWWVSGLVDRATVRQSVRSFCPAICTGRSLHQSLIAM